MSPYALFLEFSAKKSDSQSVANTCAPVCVVSGIERGAPRLANCGKRTGKRISQKLLRNIVKFLTIIYDVLRIVPMTYLKQTTDEVEMRGPESKYDTRKLNSYPSKVIPCTSTRTARFSGLGAGAFVGGFQHNLIVFWCNFQHFICIRDTYTGESSRVVSIRSSCACVRFLRKQPVPVLRRGGAQLRHEGWRVQVVSADADVVDVVALARALATMICF